MISNAHTPSKHILFLMLIWCVKCTDYAFNISVYSVCSSRLFARHPSSRHRNLYVRTFNVVPLTEDCGIIQWVNCTQGLRHCCSTTYTSLGLHHKHTLQQIKQMYDRHDKSMTRKWTKWYDEVSWHFLVVYLASFPFM